jgi:hypothetical protein
VIAVSIGLIIWLVVRDNGTASHTQTNAGSRPVATTQRKLAKLAATVRHPIFWLGPKRGFTYELTRTADGKIYVRYLPPGVKVGTDKSYLTVATYPFAGAYSTIKAAQAANGAVSARLARGGVGVLDNAYPESVHAAYPNVNYQIEVYDPMPARAMRFVSAGQLTNLGRLTSGPVQQASPVNHGKPAAVSVADLKSDVTKLGHPIFWAGAKPGYTYELTETSTGNVLLRYLPQGVQVGDPRPGYLTVATYPFHGAYAALKKVAGGTAINLTHGGIAVVDGHYPESVHLAYPGTNYQVEVFDPSPARARAIVTSGDITSIVPTG